MHNVKLFLFGVATAYREMIKFVKPAPVDEPLTKKQKKQQAGMKKEGEGKGKS